MPMTVPDTEGLQEMYCANTECGKFLGYSNIQNGLIIIKCHGCKTSNLAFTFTEDIPHPTTIEERFCKKCDRFLYSAYLPAGKVLRKCRNCGEWDVLDNLVKLNL